MATARQIKSYLAITGWSHVHTTRAQSLVYGRNDFSQTIILPTDRGLGDYELLVLQAIEALSQYEGLSIESIVEKIVFISKDIVRFRSSSRYAVNGTLPLYAWEKHYEFMVRSVKAAASVIKKPTNTAKRLRSKDAASFASKCRIGQTEVGSYVTKAIIPLGDYQPDLQDISEAAVIPFGRQLSSSIIKGAHVVSLAAEDIRAKNQTNKTDIFYKNKPLMVVCERMCSAYEEIAEAFNNKLDLYVGLQPSPELPNLNADIKRPAVLSSSFIAEIKEFHRIIVHDFIPTSTSITGFVVTLNKEIYKEDIDVGSVIIRDSDERNIRISLDNKAYHLAINAHDNKRPISVRGILKKDKKKFFLEDPVDFEIL